MAFYPEAIDRRLCSPANAGSDDVGTEGTSASFACGSFVEISVRMDVDSAGVESARFRTNGCGFMIAAADVLCDWLSEKSLEQLHGLNENELMNLISTHLGKFPPDRVQCANVVFEALRNAMGLYRERRVEEFIGEKAVICTCFGISEDAIITAISENGFTEVAQVADAYRAGSGCGSCRFLIQELIDMRMGGFD